jgi:hypothetical protein
MREDVDSDAIVVNLQGYLLLQFQADLDLLCVGMLAGIVQAFLEDAVDGEQTSTGISALLRPMTSKSTGSPRCSSARQRNDDWDSHRVI